jgi:phosphatidylserine decarboxylase
MGTKAGREAFLNPKVNTQIRNTLNAWGNYLTSQASTSVLSASSNGWLCTEAKQTMAKVATIHTHSKHPSRSFEHMFVCDVSAPNLGFKSWDDFFTRRFAPHIRPVPAPEKDESLILSACESAPYRIAANVQARTKFWVKAQPYSLVDMLANSEHVDRFVDGTVYQAYLSALSYHRWHAPVAGTVVKIEHIPGTYFAENYREPSDPQDPVGPIGHVLRQSQGYISEVAARMLMFIQADDERIGLVCAMFIGMVEVSSCEATVKEGQRVDLGEEIGMFHYGGSSYCLLFEGGRKLEFVPEARDFSGGKNVPVNSRLATVV